MKEKYYGLVLSIERSYRFFLESLKRELDYLKIHDLNNVQALMIYNLSDQTVSVGELTARGMYQGTNVSYNLKKLIAMGYVLQKPSSHDKRSVYVCLSPRGKELFQKIDSIITKQCNDIKPIFATPKSLETVTKNIQSLESFWSVSRPGK
jgi:DNA-binding MarR family transcriptional regulator